MSDLIVVYSLSGKTRQVADWLRARLGADLAEIVEERPRDLKTGMLRSLLDSFFRRKPAIKPLAKRIADYDRIILACPVWAGRIAGPPRSWLHREGREAKRLALALESGTGLNTEDVLSEIETIIGKRPAFVLSTTEADFGNRVAEGKVDAFAHRLASAMARG